MRRDQDSPPKDPAQAVAFGGPVVSPQIQDPAALQYAKDAAARRGGPSPLAGIQYTTPVSGGPVPPIPPLDAPADSGLSMSDQANMMRTMQQGGRPAGGIFQGAETGPNPFAAQAQGGPPRPQGNGLLPADLLPEEARHDPDFREGQGSMYATAQPHLAFKYGVIRNKIRLAPQQLNQAARTGLSDKTIADLQKLDELRKANEGPGDEARIEREAAESSAGVAGRLGNSPGSGPAMSKDPLTEKNVSDAVSKLDDFDFSTLRDMMMKDLINNEDQKKLIESRVEPMSIDDIITQTRVKQKVPIIVGKFEPVFQSLSGADDLAIKRLIMAESKGLEVSDRYLLDKFSLMTVTAGFYGMNNNVLPDFHDANGKWDDERFWKKFDLVCNYPFHMLSALGVHFFWFEIRVRRLFVAEKLGNG